MASMSPEVWILGSTVIAVVTSAIGFFFGGKQKVTEETCKERRDGLTAYLELKFQVLEDKIDSLKDVLNGYKNN